MLDIKKIVTAFLIGFFLSLIFGLIGHVSIGMLFLRAILFGFLFVALSFGAMFVFDKFLQTDGSVEMSNSTVESEGDGESHSVDILIDDELPDTQTAPTFEILHDNENSNQSSFVATPLVSTSSSDNDVTPEVQNEHVIEKQAVAPSRVTDLSELDELDQLLPSEDSFSEGGDDEGEFSEDLDFESGTPSLGGVTMSVGTTSASSPIDGNAKDMAAAISTMLVNDP